MTSAHELLGALEPDDAIATRLFSSIILFISVKSQCWHALFKDFVVNRSYIHIPLPDLYDLPCWTVKPPPHRPGSMGWLEKNSLFYFLMNSFI